MKIRYIILIAAMNYFLQGALSPYLRIGGIAPNMALILTVVITMLGGMKRGLAFAVVSGILQDMLLSKALGLYTMVYCFIALWVGIIEGNLFKDNRLTPAVLIIMGTLSFYTASFLILYLGSEITSPVYILTRVFPFEAAYNTAVCLLFYRRLFSKVHGYGLR